jgi:hypothetical protein
MKSIFTWIAASGMLASLAIAQSQYTVVDLGTLGGGANSNRLGIHAIGWTAGASNIVANGPQHAFLWYGFGPLINLGTLAARNAPRVTARQTG